MRKTVIIIFLAAIFSGCAVTPDGQVGLDRKVFNSEKIIPLGAGILGAVICNKLFDGHGSKKGWTAACGAAGYFVSTSFVQKHNTALERNKVGQTSTWNDPDGKTYTVTPTRTYHNGNTPCRDFRQTVQIDNQTEILTGKACRQNDGTWKLIS